MLCSKFDYKITAPKIISITYKSPQLTSAKIQAKRFLTDLYPVSIEGTKVNFNKDMMEEGKLYPFSYKKGKYFAVRTSDTVIDIYKIKE